MKVILCIFLTALIVAGFAKADAQLVINLLPGTLDCPPGTTITFAGTLQNIGTQELFLNADNISFTGVGFTLDDSMFFANSPVSLLGGAMTGRIDLFAVSSSAVTEAGFYMGNFSVAGGADNFAQDDLAATDFYVNVPSAVVPEANVWAMLMCGLFSAGCLAVRHGRSRSTALVSSHGYRHFDQ